MDYNLAVSDKVGASGRQVSCRYERDEGLLNISCGAKTSVKFDLRAGDMKCCTLNVE